MACYNCCVAIEGCCLESYNFKIILITVTIQRPEIFEWNSRIMYKNSKTIEGFFKNIARTVSNTIKNWNGFQKIAEKLINIPSYVYDNIFKEYMPTENGFNVLLHGDMWSNNIMFHYDKQGYPTDIRVVYFEFFLK